MSRYKENFRFTIFQKIENLKIKKIIKNKIKTLSYKKIYMDGKN